MELFTWPRGGRGGRQERRGEDLIFYCIGSQHEQLLKEDEEEEQEEGRRRRQPVCGMCVCVVCVCVVCVSSPVVG